MRWNEPILLAKELGGHDLEHKLREIRHYPNAIMRTCIHWWMDKLIMKVSTALNYKCNIIIFKYKCIIHIYIHSKLPCILISFLHWAQQHKVCGMCKTLISQSDFGTVVTGATMKRPYAVEWTNFVGQRIGRTWSGAQAKRDWTLPECHHEDMHSLVNG